MTVLALDPGIRGCGVALFQGTTLIGAAYVKNPVAKGDEPPAVLGMASAVEEWAFSQVREFRHEIALVFEHPRIYTVSKSKGDNNDLMPLVGVAYALAAVLEMPPVRLYPHEWKGTMPKDVCHARIRGRLSPVETKTLDTALTKAGAKGHNTLDAVGIGLKHIGRFDAKKAWDLP